MQGTGWLLAGLLGGLVTAAASPGWFPLFAALGMPAGWPRAGLAAGWVAIGLALYFRAHWAATARAMNESTATRTDLSARLERLADDLDRTAYVIADNLREVDSTGSRSLYLDGARAHAAKLGDLAARCRGLGARAAGDTGHETGPADDAGRAAERASTS